MDIKPCPFCGSMDSNPENHDENCYISELWARLTWDYDIDLTTKQDRIEMWNTRHIPDGYALVRVEPNKDDLIIQSWTGNPTNGWSLSVPNGIKITHIPTGFTAFCESERSQHKNREIAMAEIKAMIGAAQDETE